MSGGIGVAIQSAVVIPLDDGAPGRALQRKVARLTRTCDLHDDVALHVLSRRRGIGTKLFSPAVLCHAGDEVDAATHPHMP